MAKKAQSKGAKPMDKKQMKKTKGGSFSFGTPVAGASITIPDQGVARSCAKGTHIPETSLPL